MKILAIHRPGKLKGPTLAVWQGAGDGRRIPYPASARRASQPTGPVYEMSLAPANLASTTRRSCQASDRSPVSSGTACPAQPLREGNSDPFRTVPAVALARGEGRVESLQLQPAYRRLSEARVSAEFVSQKWRI